MSIWEGFKQYFIREGLAVDYLLYSNYETQVEALLEGKIHAAWNSPLAWLRAERMGKAHGHPVEAVAMRDTDRDLTSVIVTLNDTKIETLADLKGKTIGVGAKDSPQATLLPLYHLHKNGIDVAKDINIKYHDLLGGKHGDHIGGERDAARALLAREVDAVCMIDANHLLFVSEGTLPGGATRIVTQTQRYDHCNFTISSKAQKESVVRFRELLLKMSFDDPNVRTLLELEGLKKWLPARLEGYRNLDNAIDLFGFYDKNGEITCADYLY